MNSAGGLRFNQLGEELTHIVMGDTDQDVQSFLAKVSHRSVYMYIRGMIENRVFLRCLVRQKMNYSSTICKAFCLEVKLVYQL